MDTAAMWSLLALSFATPHAPRALPCTRAVCAGPRLAAGALRASADFMEDEAAKTAAVMRPSILEDLEQRRLREASLQLQAFARLGALPDPPLYDAALAAFTAKPAVVTITLLNVDERPIFDPASAASHNASDTVSSQPFKK